MKYNHQSTLSFDQWNQIDFSEVRGFRKRKVLGFPINFYLLYPELSTAVAGWDD